jgi:thiamine monophosphate synthase
LGIERWEVYGDFIIWLLPTGRIICISFQLTHYLLNLFEYEFTYIISGKIKINKKKKKKKKKRARFMWTISTC